MVFEWRIVYNRIVMFLQGNLRFDSSSVSRVYWSLRLIGCVSSHFMSKWKRRTFIVEVFIGEDGLGSSINLMGTIYSKSNHSKVIYVLQIQLSFLASPTLVFLMMVFSNLLAGYVCVFVCVF
ncbi:unnamed protein product [Cuscuta europaea]|uniref:Transmembrane protein n=1 Tax=Cuscuta europaea TaxID=41803 RepID=A0A9P1EN31_CUSEU|nr:unnamed protein product [Cuscuta europaea]